MGCGRTLLTFLVILRPKQKYSLMDTAKMKGHAAMLAANSMWGLMAPLAKFVMIGGAVSSLVMTDLRVFGAMVLFWIFSFSKSLNMWVTRI